MAAHADFECTLPNTHFQEAFLNLPWTVRGRDAFRVKDLRPIGGMVSWNGQRRQWAEIGKLT